MVFGKGDLMLIGSLSVACLLGGKGTYAATKHIIDRRAQEINSLVDESLKLASGLDGVLSREEGIVYLTKIGIDPRTWNDTEIKFKAPTTLSGEYIGVYSGTRKIGEIKETALREYIGVLN